MDVATWSKVIHKFTAKDVVKINDTDTYTEVNGKFYRTSLKIDLTTRRITFRVIECYSDGYAKVLSPIRTIIKDPF